MNTSSAQNLVVGEITIAVNTATAKIEVTKNGKGIPGSGHGLSIQRCREEGEALAVLMAELEDRSGAILLANPRVHLGLRFGSIALAEGLIPQKFELPGLNWLFEFFGKSGEYSGSIEVDEKTYPLTIHQTNFVSDGRQIRVDW